MGKVKLFGFWASPYSRRVEMALKWKGIEYEYVEEDLQNKSEELLKYNPINKKIPVLVHDGKAVIESLVIMEYIDETWKDDPILPSNSYERAQARFWSKFFDDKEVVESVKIIIKMGKVKLFGFWASPYSRRVEMALKWKGIEYEYIEEDLQNKSEELLKHNPINKKIPVLVHDGKAVTESLVIMEYIDETWKDDPILPSHSYERAQARFWSKFFDDKLMPSARIAFFSKGEENEKAVKELEDLLEIFENEIKGKKFFGGNNIGIVDIVASMVAFWLPRLQIKDKEVLTMEKYPCLCTWTNDVLDCGIIKENMPHQEKLLAFYLARFPNMNMKATN